MLNANWSTCPERPGELHRPQRPELEERVEQREERCQERGDFREEHCEHGEMSSGPGGRHLEGTGLAPEAINQIITYDVAARALKPDSFIRAK